MLGVDAFGRYAIVQSTMIVFSALAQLGIGYTATKYVAELRTHHPQRTGRLIGFFAVASSVTAALAGAALAIGAPWIASNALQAPEVTDPLRLAAIFLACAIVSGFLTGTLAGLEAYSEIGRVGVFSGIAYMSGACGGAMWGGLEGVFLGIGISGVLQSALLWRAMLGETRRQGIQVQTGWLDQDAGIIVRFALPAALNACVALPAIWFGNAILVRQPGGFEAMALFTAGNSFRILVLFLPNIINNVNMALINHHKGDSDQPGYRRVFWTNLVSTVSIVAIGVTVIALTGRWLLAFFGPEFPAAYPVLLVLLLVSVFESLSLALTQVIQSHERIWFTFWAVTLPSYSALALLAWTLVPTHSAQGLAWAYLGTWVIALTANTVMALRLGVGISPRAS